MKVKKWLKISLSVSSGIILLLIIALNVMTSCFSFTMKNKEIYKHFKKKKMGVKIKYYDFEGKKVRYMETGTKNKPTVIFVHGAPGSMTGFIDFLSDSNLSASAHLVAIDRPGYGKSGFGKSEVTIKKQAEAMVKVLDDLSIDDSAIFVGHSYGGPIISRIAMDYPQKVKSLILAAPAIDPEHEKIFKISYWIVKGSPLRWIIPRGFKVANDEKLNHIDELNKMLPLWEKITVPVTLIHGKKDGLVPFQNATFGQKVLVNSPLRMVTKDDMGHLIPWQNPTLIYDAIHNYLIKKDLKNVK